MFKTIKEIKNKDGELHFRRKLIFSLFGFQLVIHEFFGSDKDKHRHDHTCDFITIPLINGYYDQSKDDRLDGEFLDGFYHEETSWFGNLFFLIKYPMNIRFRRAEHAHKVIIFNEYSSSLCLLFPERREWGYVLKDGSWVQHTEYREMNRKGLL